MNEWDWIERLTVKKRKKLVTKKIKRSKEKIERYKKYVKKVEQLIKDEQSNIMYWSTKL